KFCCFLRQLLWRLQPKSIAVICPHCADRPAEKHTKWHTRSFGKCVPGGHINPGYGDHRKSLIADKVQRTPRSSKELEGAHTFTLQRIAEILKRGDQVLH